MSEINQQAELNLDELLYKMSCYVLLIGYMNGLLNELCINLPDCYAKRKNEWINSAIENMIYKNIPPPPMP